MLQRLHRQKYRITPKPPKKPYEDAPKEDWDAWTKKCRSFYTVFLPKALKRSKTP